MPINTLESILSVTTAAILGTAGNDTLTGGDTDDVLEGQAGADKLYGLAGNDVLNGSAGNDIMDGGLGNDVYLFGRGDGRDIVYGTGVRPIGETNTLRFKPGVLPADIGVDMTGTSLLININGTTDQFRVDGFLYGDNTSNTANPLQQIVFDDGTTWNLATIAAALYAGTAGADTRTGTYLDDKISGLAGNDVLSGKAGNDLLDGGDGNDTLDGGTGNDRVYGGVGSDTYLFGKGDGQDTIGAGPDAQAGTIDTLSFKAGVLASDIALSASGGTLIIKINGGTDQLRVENFIPQYIANLDTSQLQRFLFADGTGWNLAAINAKLYTGTDGDDVLDGASGNDYISGRGGYDRLNGADGNDTLEGGHGNDIIKGGAGDDTYVYSRGDGEDVITYVYDEMPDKFNTLQFKAGIRPEDITVVGATPGIALYVYDKTVQDGKITSENFLAQDTTDNGSNPLQRIVFADGTIWDTKTILAKLFAGTELNDRISGTTTADTITGRGGDDHIGGRAGNDTLDGGRGNDVIAGGIGSDTYLFGSGDGQDRLESVVADPNAGGVDTGNVDTLQFKTGITASDLQLSAVGSSLLIKIAGTSDQITVNSFISQESPTQFNPLQQIRFADGVTWDLAKINAELQADTAPAQASADWLDMQVQGMEVGLVGEIAPVL